jgi:hypothetical protein
MVEEQTPKSPIQLPGFRWGCYPLTSIKRGL